ncbi:MAG TPA: ATP-binding protein [Pyrinomonadaceae bacterium]|jgi:signal transduction histidine kinase/ActR/RegA family two-component response regulator|nr:ATP-binding protein [Pyrinomonadaceae bacterium]
MLNNVNAAHELMQLKAGGISVQDFPPLSDWSGMHESEHFVQFYETDSFLLNSLSDFMSAGLRAGDACIVVATQAHRESLEERLQANGLDVVAARESGQYVSLDAGETLSKFMMKGLPNPARFSEVIGGLIARAAEGRQHVRIFGEMVALLWAEGNNSGALQLEELWNELHKTRSFLLFCAYPLSHFDETTPGVCIGDVCTAHSSIIPAESFTGLTSADERLRTIIELQQKASTLQAEIAERKQAEDALRVVKEELEVQVEDLRRLHDMSVSLTSTLDVESVLEEVLGAAMSVQGTDLGLLSLCDTERGGLNVKVHSGFDKVLKDGEWVTSGAVICGTCYEQGQRLVIEDVEADDAFAAYREVARLVGFRACHSTPLFTRHGNIIGVLSVHFRQPHRPSERETRLIDLYARMAADIIENARLHQQVRHELETRQQLLSREQMARAEAESANRLKDEFLATVSHELRTPLTAIMGWAGMLGSGRLDEATSARAVETIERNARSQAQLVEDILDVSRVITGKLRLNIGPVDAASVINAAIDSVQLAADTKGIQLEVRLDPSVRRVSGDANRLQQVVWNLLSNSIKFTPSGGRVEVRLERAGSNVQIKVSDTGQGISQDFLPFIFDRFRQADGSSTRRHGGLGLGLAIVRHLVELHGGTVHVDSPGQGGGATFTIRLPLAPSQERAKGRRKESQKTGPAADAKAFIKTVPSLNSVRVLVVDDDEETLRMLNTMLTEHGAQVQAASSTAEAFELLQWYKPDVLVSDLAMPDEDGYSFIGKVRALNAESGKQIQAIALTAYVRVEDRARALSAGFNLFVPKPVEPHELISAIANLAESGRNELGLV